MNCRLGFRLGRCGYLRSLSSYFSDVITRYSVFGKRRMDKRITYIWFRMSVLGNVKCKNDSKIKFCLGKRLLRATSSYLCAEVSNFRHESTCLFINYHLLFWATFFWINETIRLGSQMLLWLYILHLFLSCSFMKFCYIHLIHKVFISL